MKWIHCNDQSHHIDHIHCNHRACSTDPDYCVDQVHYDHVLQIDQVHYDHVLQIDQGRHIDHYTNYHLLPQNHFHSPHYNRNHSRHDRLPPKPTVDHTPNTKPLPSP